MDGIDGLIPPDDCSHEHGLFYASGIRNGQVVSTGGWRCRMCGLLIKKMTTAEQRYLY